jgi:plasmid replication initiation protein
MQNSEIVTKKNADLLAQANIFTSAKQDFHLIEKRIIYKIIETIRHEYITKNQRVQKDLFDNIFIKIEVSKLKAVSENLDLVYSYAKKLRQKDVPIMENDRFITVGFINWAEHKKNSEFLEIEVSKKFVPYIVEMAKHFTTYSLTAALSLKSVYSQRFFELCNQWKNEGVFTLTLDQLRKMLSIEDKYKTWKDLNKCVLTVAHKEIKNLYSEGTSNVCFDYKIKEKKGKRIVSLEFTVYSKDKTKTSEFTKEDLIYFTSMMLKQTIHNDPKYIERVVFVMNGDEMTAKKIHDKIKARLIAYENKTPDEKAKLIRAVIFAEFEIE